MSIYDYEVSKKIAAQDYPFYALVMAAMRQADTDNLAKLQAAFPATFTELQARYHAPAGLLPGECDYREGVCRLSDGTIVSLDDATPNADDHADAVEELA